MDGRLLDDSPLCAQCILSNSPKTVQRHKTRVTHKQAVSCDTYEKVTQQARTNRRPAARPSLESSPLFAHCMYSRSKDKVSTDKHTSKRLDAKPPPLHTSAHDSKGIRKKKACRQSNLDTCPRRSCILHVIKTEYMHQLGHTARNFSVKSSVQGFLVFHRNSKT